MHRKTDMAAIRALAKVFLDFKVEYKYGFEIHPYNVWFKEGTPEFEQWKLGLSQAIDAAEKVGNILFLMKPSWHIMFLSQARPYLSPKQFAEYFADSFMETENPTLGSSFSVDDLVECFRECGTTRLMQRGEQKIHKNLPNVVNIYRGALVDDEKHMMSLSWTLLPSVAEMFASRLTGQGVIYAATIEKKHILAYFGRRGEAEVIVDPKYLKDITLYKTVECMVE